MAIWVMALTLCLPLVPHSVAKQEASQTRKKVYKDVPFDIMLVTNPSTGYRWRVDAAASVWRLNMKRLLAAAAAVVVTTLGCAHGASLLSEQQAHAKAIRILKGEPYGRTPAEVAKNIKQVQLVQDGNTKACGTKKGPAWQFHVVVVTANKDQFKKGVIDGYLALDARTEKFCALICRYWNSRIQLSGLGLVEQQIDA